MRSIPSRSVTNEQQSHNVMRPQTSGAGRCQALCRVARLPAVAAAAQAGQLQPHLGGCAFLASCIWPGGAPAKIRSYFCADPEHIRQNRL